MKLKTRGGRIRGARNKNGPRFYCGKCRQDGADHKFEECPLWRQCSTCRKEGHWSYDCPTPHLQCAPRECHVPITNRNFGHKCPISKISRYDKRTGSNPEEWGLEGVFEEPVAVAVAEEPAVSPERVFSDTLDWDSFLTFSPLQD